MPYNGAPRPPPSLRASKQWTYGVPSNGRGQLAVAASCMEINSGLAIRARRKRQHPCTLPRVQTQGAVNLSEPSTGETRENEGTAGSHATSADALSSLKSTVLLHASPISPGEWVRTNMDSSDESREKTRETYSCSFRRRNDSALNRYRLEWTVRPPYRSSVLRPCQIQQSRNRRKPSKKQPVHPPACPNSAA
jgi:hypothetical protein